MRKLIKSHITIGLASALCMVFLAGCVQYYKIYGFKRIERNFSWGRVGARLLTTSDDHLFWVNFKSPYELFIWFESDSLIQGTVQIVELKLVDADTKAIVFDKVNIQEESFKKNKYQQRYGAYFSFQDLKLKYTDKILKIKFSLTQGGKITVYDTKLSLKTDYEGRIALTS